VEDDLGAAEVNRSGPAGKDKENECGKEKLVQASAALHVVPPVRKG
jgi:hypothetical protein